jgi:hypothetical protein
MLTHTTASRMANTSHTLQLLPEYLQQRYTVFPGKMHNDVGRKNQEILITYKKLFISSFT